jgi:4,5-dihydroxyphthalate decarboxylase
MESPMPPVPLTVACAPYDRVVPIIDGRVRIEGCDVQYFSIEAEEAFHRAYAGADFDVTELSASSHILTTARGQAHYVALPIFLSRVFRHSAFYIRTDRGIRSPEDLRGRIVGVPEYQMTAALWARGILSDEYGVKAQDVRWRNGGLNVAGRGERTPITLPPEIELKPIAATATLSDMLEAGEIDAVVTARAPACFTRGAANVGRLFPDVRAAEEVYYRKTRMFPIMHVVAIRRSLVEAHPWLAASVTKAFHHAKQIALHEMDEVGVLSVMLPWLGDDLARVRAVMGPDPWPYGVPENRKEIDAMLRWSYEQGLSGRLVAVEEIFAPGTLHKIQLKD